MCEIITIDPTDIYTLNSALRQVSRQITPEDNIALLLENLLIAFYKVDHAHGLSAIQIGLPLQLAIINLERKVGNELILINPKLITSSGRMSKRREGCVSLPNYHGEVRRRHKILINYSDQFGNIHSYASSGYEAAVIQHELDHMNGKLYWDRMSDNLSPVLRQEYNSS